VTLDEAKNLCRGEWIYHRNARQGGKGRATTPLRARVTSVKTWVRQPDRVEVRAVHGLKGYFTIWHERDLANWFVSERKAVENSDEERTRRMRYSAIPHGRCPAADRCIEPVPDEEKCR